MIRVTFDDHGIKALSIELGMASAAVTLGAVRATVDAADEVRDFAKGTIRARSRGEYLRHYPESITSELTMTGLVVEAEIGPEYNRRQGGLGQVLEYGTSHSPPIPHMHPAADQALHRYRARLADVLSSEVLE